MRYDIVSTKNRDCFDLSQVQGERGGLILESVNIGCLDVREEGRRYNPAPAAPQP